MKVLQINSFFTVGGPPRIMEGFYDYLKTQGHDCKIADAREKVRVPQDSHRIGSGLDVRFNALQARFFDDDGFIATRATKNLVAWIKEYDPDVVHLHNLHGYYVNMEVLLNFLQEFGKPIIWTLHDCWAFTGHCPYFDLIGCAKWKSGCCKCPQKNGYPNSIWLDRSRRNFERKKRLYEGLSNLTIVTPSQWLANLVRSDSILSKFPVEVVHNGVDLNVFKPTHDLELRKKYASGDEKIVLGVAQVWGERKGLNDFYEIRKRLPDEYKIILVGLRRKQIQKLPSGICGIERTQNVDELVKLYGIADVFVNPTYEDTFPTVNLEALASGTPVIAYRTGGCPEIVSPQTGRVIEKGDIETLKKNIVELCKLRIDSDLCSSRAYLFERNVRYQEYIDLYSKML